MLHLVANYPNPTEYSNSLRTILEFNPEYLEIQLPFSNPMADGPTIYNANQVARVFDENLEQVLEKAKSKKGNSETKLILMSYLTPLSIIEPEYLVELLVQNNFSGAIIPDLAFGSPEQLELSRLFANNNLYLIPVIASNSTTDRLEFIRSQLQPQQPIYVMARFGKTGTQSDLNQELCEYLARIQTIFDTQKICVGFGISSSQQVKELQNHNYTPVIGSAIVKSIENNQLQNFLNQIIL